MAISDEAYTSEVIVCPPGAYVHSDVRHYLVKGKLPDGWFVLAPTQGKLVLLGELEGAEVWTYLRYHRRPFFVSTRPSIVCTISSSSLPGEIVERANELARTTEVSDRRHISYDADFPTPGKTADGTVEAAVDYLIEIGFFQKPVEPANSR